MAGSNDLTPRRGEVLPPEGAPDGRDLGWVKTGFVDRYRNRRVAKTVQELTESVKVATQFQHAALDYERARQDLIYVRGQAALLPVRLEQDQARLFAELMEIEAEIDVLLHRRELAHKDHDIALLRREEERIATKIRIHKAKIEKDRVKAERYRQTASSAAPPAGDMPEALRRNMRTADEVNQNRKAADQRIAAIYARAQAERRHLTPEELHRVRELEDAADAAESDVRRRAASDFE